MIKERAWPAKVMYMLIAAALAISLIIMAAPAQKVSAEVDVKAEWDMVSTPTTDGWVLAPNSTIIDYAIADGGEVAYAIVYSSNGTTLLPYLLKSEDHAATWEDITDELVDLLEDEGHNLTATPLILLRVACDWEDPDFLAVALAVNVSTPAHMYISTDGGSTFLDEPGEVVDGTVALPPQGVADLAVSPEDDGERDIAIVGRDNSGLAAIFRCTAEGDSVSGWEDARYDGWDDTADPVVPTSIYVTDVKFAPSWTADKTILVTTVTPATPWTVYLQSGTWGTTEGWNAQSVVAIDAVPIIEDVDMPTWFPDARGMAGLTLPLDYSGRNTYGRYVWVWVNYYWDYGSGPEPACTIFKVKNDDADPVGPMGQVEDGEVWLTNVSYLGYISEGKAIAGVLGSGESPDGEPNPMDLLTECCEGVQVYRNDGIFNMDVCCEPWEEACKPPTGALAMAAFYVSDDPATSKAYAVALYGLYPYYDEGAWSVSFDDGDVWNQLSLIDTNIDYLSDVAVSPDCNKTMLVSVNLMYTEPGYSCGCDSVWLHAENLPEAEEYSGKWLRTWCGMLIGENNDAFPDFVANRSFPERGLLRLAPEETNGDTVYLVDRMSDTVYWNELETLYCWNQGAATVNEIVDLAVKDRETIYALDDNGKVAMSDDYALGWHTGVESEVDNGWTIVIWGDHILVGGTDGEVSYSDDGGETFTDLDDVASSGYVTVAFDSYFDTNGLVYAALAMAGEDNNVYRYDFDKEEPKWENLRAEVYDYTGLVVDNADGNPMTSADTGGVIYASYVGNRSATSECWSGNKTWSTGVARRLYPAEEVVCGVCGWWDYLTVGLTDVELFNMMPDALKICGCLTPDTNSKLFAIDGSLPYDMVDGEEGTVWTFEDCYAKKAPDLTSPEDGFVVPADPCSCFNVPFNLAWDRLCDACSYDIQVAMDEEFEQLVVDAVEWTPGAGDAPSFHIPGGGLTCEFTYYWRVRAADAENCQIIHSWWSEPREVTIAPSQAAGEIHLVSPEPGATGVGIKNVGFSWDLLAEADAFDWVLDDNSDLSSPVESKTALTSTAYECTETLEYSTSYYWQVTAYNEGAAISTSAVGTFTTTATGQFCCPQCGLCFDTQEELEDHIAEAHPAQPVTPTWVWVVIAIGAVLVIVVIVLIFRTRRV